MSRKQAMLVTIIIVIVGTLCCGAVGFVLMDGGTDSNTMSKACGARYEFASDAYFDCLEGVLK